MMSNIYPHGGVQDIPVEEVRLQLNGRDSTQMIFTTKVSGIVPGLTELTLFCPVGYFRHLEWSAIFDKVTAF